MTENHSEKVKRLIHIRKLLRLKQDEIAKILGINRANLSAIENNRENRKLPNGTSYILEKELNVNKEWFETGEGDVFIPEIKSNARLIGSLPETESDETFVEISPGRYRMKVKLVPEFAQAGYLVGFSDPEYMEELPLHEVTVTTYHRGNYRAFEVSGDSMYDGTINSVPEGTIVTGREIKRDLWTSKFHTHKYPNWIIVHKTEGIVCKQIAKQDLGKGTLTLHSLNPDKEKYADFVVHLDDVIQIYNVVKRELP